MDRSAPITPRMGPWRAFRTLVIEPLSADVDAWRRPGGLPVPGRGGWLGWLLVFVRTSGLRATLLYRLGRWANVRGIPALSTITQQLNLWFHGIELSPAFPIGAGLYLPHTTGSVVYATSIGKGVTLQGGITIGMNQEAVFPTIGDGVVIGPGARVLGDLTVGRGAMIGANSVVLHDVPAEVTVVGVPARAIPRQDGDQQAVLR